MNDFAELDVDDSDLLQEITELDRLYFEVDDYKPIAPSSNKFNPIMETKQQRSDKGNYSDRNPRRWESRQIKVANRRWRRSGRYNGQTFDDFESLARSRFSALEDRWYW